MDQTTQSDPEQAPPRQGGAGQFIHADAHVRTGSGHEREGTPCQDYASAGRTAATDLAFAVLSDGCSSAGRTDLGSRTLVLAAAKAIRQGLQVSDRQSFSQSVLRIARQAACILELEAPDLEATLGVVASQEDGSVHALIMGDGVVVARTAAGFDVRIVDWAGNMPGYPVHLLSASQTELFLAASTAVAREEGRPACVVRRCLLDEAGRVMTDSVEGVDAQHGLRGIIFEWPAHSTPDSVAVMSDGVLQIHGVEWQEATMALGGFKTAREGQFVRRRMSRALQAYARTGNRPIDDLAVAAIATRGLV